MKKKDVKLFNKAIHQVKFVVDSIHKDREKYYKELSQMRTDHNKAMKKRMKTLLKVVDEMQELFEDLYEENGGKK